MEPRITVTGNVGASVNLRVTPRGRSIGEFTIASNRRVLNEGQWSDAGTTWLNVRCLGNLAVNVVESISKGDPVVVTGRLEDDTWHPSENETRTKTWVIADSVGHDLSRGVATFRRTSRPVEQLPPASPGASAQIEASPTDELRPAG